MKVGDVTARWAEEGSPTFEQVWAEAERIVLRSELTKDGTVTEMLAIWRDAQRVSHRPGDQMVSSYPPGGRDSGLLKTIGQHVPAGTLPFLLVLLGARWPSFLEHMVATGGWKLERMSRRPDLSFVVMQLPAVLDWAHQQRDETPRSAAGPNRMNELLRRIHDEAGQGGS